MSRISESAATLKPVGPGLGNALLRIAHSLGETAGTVQEIRGQMHHATHQSQVGSPAHQIEFLQKFGRFESEMGAAQDALERAEVALERANDEYQRAVTYYNTLLTETADTPESA